MRYYLFNIFLIVFHITVSSLAAQTPKTLINSADSLFKSKQLAESKILYERIFNETKQYSPDLLLKLAFISGKEGDLALQLYYLCTLYRHHPTGKVLKKIEAISEDNDLQGYSYSDIEYFISVYKQYYDKILLALIISSLIFCGYIVMKKISMKKLGYHPALFLLFLAFLYVISNYSLIPPRAIINKNYSLLMDEPSAASQVMTVANIGHRITLLGKSDIWYLVGWEGSRYYIKESDLLIIPESQPYLF